MTPAFPTTAPARRADPLRRARAAVASVIAVLSLLGAAVAVHAQPAAAPPPAAQALYTRSLAATCANCHGTDGRAAADSSIGALAGLDRTYLATQLRDFKSGKRPATVMHQISKGYSDAQLDALATYFAGQAK